MKKLILVAVLAALLALPATVMTRETLTSPSPAGIMRSESAGRVLRSSLGRSFESRVTHSRGESAGGGEHSDEAVSLTEPLSHGPGFMTGCPNPFNPTTTIRYRLPEATGAELAIYDVSGRLVRTFAGLRTKAGATQEVVWDGTSDEGSSLPSGVYLLMMRTDSSVHVGKLVLLK